MEEECRGGAGWRWACQHSYAPLLLFIPVLGGSATGARKAGSTTPHHKGGGTSLSCEPTNRTYRRTHTCRHTHTEGYTLKRSWIHTHTQAHTQMDTPLESHTCTFSFSHSQMVTLKHRYSLTLSHRHTQPGMGLKCLYRRDTAQ